MSRAEQLRLDWSRPEVLHAAWDVLAADQQQRLERVWSKAGHSEQLRREFGLPRHRYRTQGSIYAMSGWDHADSYSLCGYRFNDGHIHDCGLWKFCPRCSHRRKWAMLCQFGLHYRATAWKFLTISFAGDIGEADLAQCSLQEHWDAARTAVTMLQRSGRIRGCVWREEVQVRSFQPLYLRPHLHALCDAPDLDETEVDTLMRSARFCRSWSRAGGPLFPDDEEFCLFERESGLGTMLTRLDIDCRDTPTARAFQHRLSYMQKEIALRTPYRAVTDASRDFDFTALNCRVERFLRLFSRATRNRKQSGTTGTLHPLSPRYIGTQRALFTRTHGETPSARTQRERHRERIQRLFSNS